MPAIQIESLMMRYGHTLVLNNLSMRVPRGSIYGLVGPNGAGVTTTLRILATLQKPDSGSVMLEDIDVVSDPAAARGRVGYMPDAFGVYEDMSVAEYLDFYGAGQGVPASRRRTLCGELLELVDLEDRRAAPVRTLSRGMKQRLSLARCLIHDPSVLLLDDPASGMDPRSRLELQDILRELSGLDKTILVSSHVLPELAAICTHIGIMRAGAMIAEGPIDDVIAAFSPSGGAPASLEDVFLAATEGEEENS